MPINKVNIGAAANDGSGDTLREAFGKINDNLELLAAAVAARLQNQWAFAPLRHEHDGAVARYVGNSAPSEPPPTFGAMWVDASANKIYLATGTASVADWKEIAFVRSGEKAPGSPK